MEFFNFIQKDKQGNISFYLPKIPDSNNITASVFKPSGAEDGTITVTYTATSASLMSGSNPGDYSLYASQTSFLKKGEKFLVTNSTQDFGAAEFVTIKTFSTSSNLITVLRPMISEHLFGDKIASTKIKMTIPSTSTGTIGKGYKIQIDYSVGGEAQEPITLSFQVTRYLPATNLSFEHIRDIDPTLGKKIPSGFQFEELKAITWNALLTRVSANYSPGSLVGTVDLTLPHAYYVKMVIFESAGKDYEDQRMLMAERFENEFKQALAACAFDEKQNGDSSGQYLQQMRLVRV